MDIKHTLTLSDNGCKDCYKCIRNCPVKAIAITENKTEVDASRCIACGKCFIVCPQNDKAPQYHLIRVRSFANNNNKLVASIDPTFLAYFPKSEKTIVTALKKLGFHHVEETAVGIDRVLEEYKNYYNQTKQNYYITTTCSACNLMIQKYYPHLNKYMIPILPPMMVHGKLLRKKYGDDIKVVYFTPCIASKIECTDTQLEDCSIDAVITFDELKDWMTSKNIVLEELEEEDFDQEGTFIAKKFPVDGLKSMTDRITSAEDFLQVNGGENIRQVLESIAQEELDAKFIEINFCLNGCINGPTFYNSQVNLFTRKKQVSDYANKKAIENNLFELAEEIKGKFYREFNDKRVLNLQPSNIELRKILKKMGKFNKKDELNCGTCGYETCRDKAVAIYNHMDTPNMCLPYIRNKSETMSNLIFEYSPNYIFLVNKDLKILSINPAGIQHLNVEKKHDDLHLATILDYTDYMEVFETKKSIYGKKIRLEDHNLTIIQNLLYIEKQDSILAILNDVTKTEEKEKELIEVKKNTAEMVQKVITKQMVIAQQICSVLGETTAETKVALKKFLDLTMEKSGDE
ncbi:[Fe-Fe] hydrogenase large subunit C-terminal domain-containing protein [Natronincola ferrireducens]|uniref:Iron only hydrogenase large subunit, C-terminal domain n=1 Tax=Natronincola ferrireducens TaxID=393762 RepID=A0A1G9EL30_9FIRM|nr:[Fe-Fe] hydrogenase large subunit C-terminal domain-containing protein [Natronincola ferrireducens]SDK76882.1 Iron only hydrogenase large subunit, C-terminal domain [Natronincola ferrireducens]